MARRRRWHVAPGTSPLAHRPWHIVLRSGQPQLHAVRLHARTEWASGLSRWRPWRLRLVAPLQLHNLLPCAVSVSLRQLSPAEWERISTMGGVDKASLSGEGIGEALHVLEPNASEWAPSAEVVRDRRC